MNSEPEINTFAHLAKEYCSWVENPPGTPEEELYLAACYIARLYSAGLELPQVEPIGDFHEPDFTIDRYQRLHKRFGGLPFQYYYEVFNPFALYANDPEEPVIGDVCDDLADIYRDLREGLAFWEKGEYENAVYSWNFTFRAHWGGHATSALRALHCFVSSEERGH